jgi:hypothetical protein
MKPPDGWLTAVAGLAAAMARAKARAKGLGWLPRRLGWDSVDRPAGGAWRRRRRIVDKRAASGGLLEREHRRHYTVMATDVPATVD